MDTFLGGKILAFKIGKLNDNVLLASSLRPEHFAAIGALTYLHHQSKYFNYTIQAEIRQISDNLEVLRRQRSYFNNDIISPNSTISTDYDCTLQFFNLLESMDYIDYSLLHVKSHQDKNISKKRKRSLPLEVRINCLTDFSGRVWEEIESPNTDSFCIVKNIPLL